MKLGRAARERRVAAAVVTVAFLAGIFIVVAMALTMADMRSDLDATRADLSRVIEDHADQTDRYTKDTRRIVQVVHRRVAAQIRRDKKAHDRLLRYMRAVVRVAGLDAEEVERRARGSGSSQQR